MVWRAGGECAREGPFCSQGDRHRLADSGRMGGTEPRCFVIAGCAGNWGNSAKVFTVFPIPGEPSLEVL